MPTRRPSRRRLACLTGLLLCAPIPRHAAAAEAPVAVSTVNHAFATELGSGFYDIGGRSVFIATVTPAIDLRNVTAEHAGLRLVAPMAAGSFGFAPDDAIEGRLPHHVDSFSIMPGLERDYRLREDWILTPWARVGGSFAAGADDGLLYGAGARLSRDLTLGKDLAITQLHELELINVDYRNLPDASFLRLRNAVDARETLPLSLGPGHRLLAGMYGILDVMPDPPAAPAGVKPTVLQLEVGLTFNADPRPQLGWLNWPRLGFGYRFAGKLSGWRIVVGAPF